LRLSELDTHVEKGKKPNANTVSQYFINACVGNELPIWDFNKRAFSHQVKLLNTKGLPYEDIITMIDIFTTNHKDWCKNNAPWKVFLNKKSILLGEAEKKNKQQQIEQERTTGKGGHFFPNSIRSDYEQRLADAVKKMEESGE
jgi:hypothetical protein